MLTLLVHFDKIPWPMNFSAIPKRSVLGKILRWPLALIPRQAVVPILQGPLRGWKWVAGSTNHGYWLGSHEYDKQRLFAQVVRNGSVVYDIGANVGFYTLLAASLAGPEGKVYAFEPAPLNIQYLKEHLRLNKVSNATVLEAAVCDSTGEATFDEGMSRSTGRISPAGRLAVRTVSLDELIARGEIALPDVIKIDVEGGELAVLEGGRDTLESKRPLIFLATHGEQAHIASCRLLQGLGYRMRSIERSKTLEQASEILAEPL